MPQCNRARECVCTLIFLKQTGLLSATTLVCLSSMLWLAHTHPLPPLPHTHTPTHTPLPSLTRCNLSMELLYVSSACTLLMMDCHKSSDRQRDTPPAIGHSFSASIRFANRNNICPQSCVIEADGSILRGPSEGAAFNAFNGVIKSFRIIPPE